MTRYATPETLNLPQGEYQISIIERVIKNKWKVPFVHTFAEWSDGCLTPSRRVLLNRDKEFCARFEIDFKASLKLWAKKTLNRFNDAYKKYEGLFWLIEKLLWFLFALSNFLELFKTKERLQSSKL